MDKLRKVLALMLALAMIFGLAACTSGGSGEQGGTDEPETNETPLVVGYSPFSSKFSPFFSETAYDQDVYAMTQISLLNSDRMGAVVEKGIEGTTIPYNGTDYTYYGPADVEITQNADGTVYYDFTLRDDLTFSDGENDYAPANAAADMRSALSLGNLTSLSESTETQTVTLANPVAALDSATLVASVAIVFYQQIGGVNYVLKDANALRTIAAWDGGNE